MAKQKITNSQQLFSVSSQSNAGTAGGTIYYMNLGGMKMAWGTTGSCSVSGTGDQSSAYGITWPTSFFSTIQSCTGTPTGAPSNTQYLYLTANATPTTTAWSFYLCQTNGTNGATAGVSFVCIGT